MKKIIKSNSTRRRRDAHREFLFAVGKRLIDAAFATAASMAVRAVLAVSLVAAIADLTIGIFAAACLTVAAFAVFSRAGD